MKNLLVLTILGLSLSSCTFTPDQQNIEKWHELRSAGDVDLVKNDYPAAQKSFLAALKIAEAMHFQPVREAVSLQDLSKICLDTNNLKLASTISLQALDLANKRSQAPKKQADVLESCLGECLNNVGRVFARAKEYDQAAICYREARVIFFDLFQRSPVMVANLIIGSHLASAVDGLGISYRELGQLKEARQAYLSVSEKNIVQGLPEALRERLFKHYCQIPDTSPEEKKKYASILKCSGLVDSKMPETNP